LLAELHATRKEWICTFHEHDTLLENSQEQELSEKEKAAAWDDYEHNRGSQRFGRDYDNNYDNLQGMYSQYHVIMRALSKTTPRSDI